MQSKKDAKVNPFITFGQGLALGIAEIIPGVSGSTVALLFGIYDDFIDLLYKGLELVKAVALAFLGRKKMSDVESAFKAIRWQFGILLGLGMVTAILSLSSFIVYVLFHLPHYLFAFLIGLTAPTMYIVYKQISKPATSHLMIAAITAAIFLSIFVIGEGGAAVTNPHPLHLFLGGMAAISAMVLPGVSGSFMLLILGLYNFAIGLVASAKDGLTPDQLTSLGILVAGVFAGLLSTVRLLKWAFEKKRNELMSFLLGLLTASWYVLWPFVEVVGEDHGEPVLGKVAIASFSTLEILMITGLAILTAAGVYQLHSWADTRDTKSPKADSGFDQL